MIMMTMMTADSDIFFGNMRNSLILPSPGYYEAEADEAARIAEAKTMTFVTDHSFTIYKHTVSTYISFEQVIRSQETTQTHTNKRYSRGTLFQTDLMWN